MTLKTTDRLDMNVTGVRLLGQKALEAAGVDLGSSYELLIDRVADRVMRAGSHVIDGGANTGRHTIPFAQRVAPNGRVYAFEPLHELVQENIRSADREQLAGIIEYHECALSDRNSEVVFYRNLTDAGLSSLAFQPEGTDVEEVRVRASRMDDVLPDVKADFIKLDLEGYEYPALLGAVELVGRSRPVIVLENAREWAARHLGYDRDRFLSYFSDMNILLYDGFGRRLDVDSWANPDAGWYFWAIPQELAETLRYEELAETFWRERLDEVEGEVRVEVKSEAPDPVYALPPHLVEKARVFSTRFDMLRSLPEGLTFCEVGGGLGEVAEVILQACKPHKIVMIDTFTLHLHASGQEWLESELSGQTQLGYLQRKFQAEIELGQVELQEGGSNELLSRLEDGSVDVFYLNYPHEYKSCYSQYLRLAPKLRPGGRIVRHDYTMVDFVTGARYGIVPATNRFMVERGWEMESFALHAGMYCDVMIRKP
jgi:FkbM family methyltransferase